MRKKTLIQIAVVFLLVLLGVAVLLVLNHTEPADDTSDVETIYALGGVPQRTVTQVRIQNGLDTYSIAYDADSETASVDDLDTNTLNQTLLSSLVNNLGSLTASRVIGESVEDLSVYGLDHPQAVASITYTDGEATLALGDTAPGEEGSYVQVDGGTVYLVETESVSTLSNARLGFVNTIFTSGNSVTTEMERAVLSGSGLGQSITVQQDETATSGYAITSPVTCAVDATAMTDALQGLYGLTAMEVVVKKADVQDSSMYGLDTPYLQAEITSAPEDAEETDASEASDAEDAEETVAPFTLYFSAPDEAGFAYVTTDQSPYIFRVETDSVPVLDMTLFDYMEKIIAAPDLDTLNEVEVTAGDTTAVFALDGEEDSITVTCNGESMETETFEPFFQTLTAAWYDAEVTGGEEAGNTAGEELLRYTYRFRDGTSEQTVVFCSGPVRRALVSRDGGTAYLIPSTYVDRVISDLNTVLQGGTVSAYA